MNGLPQHLDIGLHLVEQGIVGAVQGYQAKHLLFEFFVASGGAADMFGYLLRRQSDGVVEQFFHALPSFGSHLASV
jgi:hypothetical protein